MDVNKLAHDAAMKAIRGGDTAALDSQAGVLTINVFPLIEGVLGSLQDNGLISADRNIPDLSGFEASPDRVAKLEALLGRDLPDDIGSITLVDSENLAQVQTVIRWFDLITLVFLLLAVLFVALALWFADKRIRMILWLSGGAIAALLTGRVITRLILEAITRRQEEAGGRILVSAIVDAAVDSLMWFTFILIGLAVIVALAAIVVERGQGGERASMETPLRTLAHWVHDNMSAAIAVGIGIIVVLALWSTGGPDIALLTLAAIGLLVIVVKVVANQDDDTSAVEGHEG